MKIRAFIIQHKAERIVECQDRFSINKETRIVAVSDGVSQSIFPDYWAQLLVDHYTAKGELTNDDRVLLCKEWKNQVKQFITTEKEKGNNPWRAESNINEGISAGATLCGVRFEDNKNWICNVIGDSCLIKIDKNNSVQILSSEEKKFDSYPDFLDSNPQNNGRGSFKTFTGSLSEKDKLLLVSDPFSDFFDNLKEKSADYIAQLLNITNHEEYAQLVRQWRDEGMHNDDSTVIIVEWDGDQEFNIVSVDTLTDLIESEKNEEIEKQTKKESVDDTLNMNKTNEGEIPVAPQKICQKPNLEVFEQVCLKQIPSFIEDLVNEEIRSPQYTGFKSIIHFVFERKVKKTNELSNLLNIVLTKFVKTIK